MKSSNLKALWPTWLPYPSAWIEALILAAMMIPLGYSLLQSAVIATGAALITNNLGITFFFLVIGYILPFVGFAYIHSYLWGNSPDSWPKSLPAPRSIFEGFYGLSSNFIATLGALTVLLFIMNPERTYTEEAIEVFSAISGTFWLIIAAYLCQAKRWIWKGMELELRKKQSYRP
ncbi:hypothetical protein [Microcoleus sp. FACHB-672]|uniref:hypothetical protein n=1 Tax=Microcoleus sp. FACHB-672 TaxID=2692825 RepID=UPI0016881DCF|nr:hypothetical protein [Microcoleus sp. FACHB-672]MBD2039699.1 hypothetical protein [Microcoleus sp. FACHB-672]